MFLSLKSYLVCHFFHAFTVPYWPGSKTTGFTQRVCFERPVQLPVRRPSVQRLKQRRRSSWLPQVCTLSHFYSFLFVKKSIICQNCGKSWPLVRENLFSSIPPSYVLLSVLGPLKGFWSWHGVPQSKVLLSELHRHMDTTVRFAVQSAKVPRHSKKPRTKPWLFVKKICADPWLQKGQSYNSIKLLQGD